MNAASAPGALALLFILVMVWFRTRLHYAKASAGPLRLTRAGAGYFAALLALLAVGWFAAPVLVHSLGLAALLPASFARVAWFLAVYLGFIPLHRMLLARGIRVLRTT
ncbi:MAG TPA: hypothetical protein VGF35_07070 [Steroidobacteraceae bacterium]